MWGTFIGKERTGNIHGKINISCFNRIKHSLFIDQQPESLSSEM